MEVHFWPFSSPLKNEGFLKEPFPYLLESSESTLSMITFAFREGHEEIFEKNYTGLFPSLKLSLKRAVSLLSDGISVR